MVSDAAPMDSCGVLMPTQDRFFWGPKAAMDTGLAESNKEPDAGLLEELADISQRLETASAEQILAWAWNRFSDRFTFATAFGPEGMVVLHFLAKVAPSVRVVNIDTGYQFPETLQLRDRVLERYGIDVELLRPELSVEAYEAANGGPVYSKDPNRCCGERKLAVLYRAASRARIGRWRRSLAGIGSLDW
jgi:phosphoadenosine phosphosulfate reductase